MPWFYVDDGFTHSKPVMAMPDRYRLPACGLWLLGGAWSAREKMDGRVTPNMLRQLLGNTRQPLREVLEATDGTYEPLWVPGEDGGAQTHLWSKWQPTAQQLRDERAANAERTRRWREQRKPDATPVSGRKRRGRNAATSDDAEMSHVTATVTPEPPANTCNDARMKPPDPDPLVVTYGGNGKERNARVAVGADAPPPQCPKHPQGPDHSEPCGPCRAVRVYHSNQAGIAVQKAAQRDQQRYEWERGIHRCDLCGDSGMIFRPGPHGETNPNPAALYVRCPHDRRQLVAILDGHAARVAATLAVEHAERADQPGHVIARW